MGGGGGGFVFQAEDGIRDSPVTGVQTCALPIYCYKCSDSKWLWMLGLEGDRHWPQVIAALGVSEWLEDERFSSIETRMENSSALTAQIDAILETKERDEWGRI